MYKNILLIIIIIILILASCTPASIPEPAVSASTGTALPATITPTVLPTLTAVPTATLPAMDDFMKGLVYYPAGWGGDQRPETEWMLKNIVLPTGANWIRLHLACNQDSVTSTQVYCDPQQALSDEAYIHLVKTAHNLGLRVMSEHYINSVGWEGYWAGDIGDKYNEQQWAEWFSSYGAMVLHYAKLAETAGTDYIIISSELDSTTRREAEWRELIAKVREVYHGKISMAYSDEYALEEVQFWDALDAITIHPYYLDLPGVTDPTVEQLTNEFIPYADRLEALSKKWDRPILITEIGFWSVHTMSQNYNNLDSSTQIDLQEQADLFQAVLNVFYGKEWLDGIFWYAFSGIANYAEPWNSHNDYIGKPAENVIRSFYGAQPMPTSTPVIFPDANLPKSEVIYDDELNPDWSNYPPEGDPANVQFDQSEVAVSGSAIKAKLLTFWTLDFRSENVDWTNYQWLEFDLYVQPRNIPRFYTVGLSLRDTIYQSSIYKLELLQSQFIQGGRIEPGTWQHVEVPLDVFGPLLSEYQIISIDRPPAGRTNDPLTIYVDNVILSGTPLQISSGDQNPVEPTKARPSPTPTNVQAQPQPTRISSQDDFLTTTGKDGATLVYVPAGKFTMGTNRDANVSGDEKPDHQVDLSAFWIDETEVTIKQYAACVSDGKCTLPLKTNSETRPSYYGNAQFDNFPVIYVDWNQANAYCSWAGRRLPTEAEWEKAARGTDARMYTWGNGRPDETLLNYNRNIGDTTEVRNYPDAVSYYGAYDMLGNVWEWVNDWYSESYYQNSPVSNPLGPVSGEYHVLRGGSWYYMDGYVRTALRSRFYPSDADSDGGIRCALSALQSTELSPDRNDTDGTSHYYDDFNDPSYEGSLNTDSWIRVEDPSSSTQVFQQDGILVLSDSGDTVGQGALLEFRKWQKPIFSFFEARIKVHYESGSNGNLALAGVSDALRGGWTEMSLTPDADGATMRVLGFAQARVENDTWYVLRIEYDDEKNVLSFFLDGTLVTSYEAPNKVESLVPEVNLWHPERGSGVGFIDYIAIGD